jgi:hypothetical protein
MQCLTGPSKQAQPNGDTASRALRNCDTAFKKRCVIEKGMRSRVSTKRPRGTTPSAASNSPKEFIAAVGLEVMLLEDQAINKQRFLI